jgi:hypothetical protein
MRKIKNINFIARAEIDDEMVNGSPNTYGVLQVYSADEDDIITEISELKVDPCGIDKMIKLLEATKESIFKLANNE